MRWLIAFALVLYIAAEPKKEKAPEGAFQVYHREDGYVRIYSSPPRL